MCKGASSGTETQTRAVKSRGAAEGESQIRARSFVLVAKQEETAGYKSRRGQSQSRAAGMRLINNIRNSYVNDLQESVC